MKRKGIFLQHEIMVLAFVSSEPLSRVNRATTMRTTKYGGAGHALTDSPG